MFVAVYRWRVNPELEEDFVANRQRITLLGLASGSGGSCSFKDTQGCWVAIARWTSRSARDHFFHAMEGHDAEPGMRERAARAIIERFPVQELESVVDCWAPFSEMNVVSGA